MNLLIVADVDLQGEVSGAERVLAAHCIGLEKRGHRVHLIAGISDRHVKEAEEVQGVQIHRYQRSFRSLLGSLRLFQDLSGKNKFDALIFHQPLSALGVAMARESRAIPKAYVFHSPWAEEYAARSTNSSSTTSMWKSINAGSLIRRTVEYFVLATCHRVFVLSRFMADRFIKFHPGFGHRVRCLPGGVDLDRFKPAEDRQNAKGILGLPSDTPLLLTVRNLEPRMGLDHLLYAMREVMKKAAGRVNLIIGGDGPLRGELQALAEQLGLGTSVRFEGFIPEKRLPSYYQAADFFILPTKALEGFGLVAVEALACGTPVLGTPVGAIPELLGALQPNLLFDGVAPESIARGILGHLKRAQGDRRGYEALRRRCREYATARFGWDRVIERLEQELLNLTGNSGGDRTQE